MSSQFTLNMQRQPSIRREAIMFEDALRPNYGQAVIFPVPDEMDPSVARILFSSTHGFSQIGISQNAMSLSVNYSDDEWQTGALARNAYLSERISQLFNLAHSLKDAPIQFCGLINIYRLQVEGDDEDIMNSLQDEFLCSKDPDLQDLIVKYTHKIKGRFFSNTTIQNYRELPGLPSIDVARVPYGSAVTRGVTITHDFNDRLAFNEDPRYFSSETAGREILGESDATLRPFLARIMGAFNAV